MSTSQKCPGQKKTETDETVRCDLEPGHYGTHHGIHRPEDPYYIYQWSDETTNRGTTVVKEKNKQVALLIISAAIFGAVSGAALATLEGAVRGHEIATVLSAPVKSAYIPNTYAQIGEGATLYDVDNGLFVRVFRVRRLEVEGHKMVSFLATEEDPKVQP